MSDRPRGNGGPEKGTPEYNWLYGSQGSSSTPDDEATQFIQQNPSDQDGADDSTRVMPAQRRQARGRPSASSGPASGSSGGRTRPTTGPANEPPPASRPAARQRPVPPPPPPPQRRGSSYSSRPRRPRRPLRWVFVAFVCWIAFLVIVPILALGRVDDVDAWPSGDRPEDQPGKTYLVVGSDSRDDLSEDERKELTTGGSVGQRTDTIMLLHTGDGPNLLMSIPRDSIVDIPGHGTTKVNASYAFGGPKLLVKTIEQNTGIRIDDYIEIGFGGFVDVVDGVGGIEICPRTNMKDKLAGLDIEKGCQEADGAKALGYARSRHTSGLGDIDRARRQREVVSAVGSEVVSPWTVINPIRYFRVVNGGAGAVSVSEGTGAFTMARFAMAMTRVNGDNGLTCGVPIADLAVNWDAERSERMFNLIAEDRTDDIGRKLCSKTGLPR